MKIFKAKIDMNNLNTQTIIDRVKAETPVFWKKIRYVMVSCGAVGAALIALPVEYISFLPSNTGGVFVTIGAIGTALASMTVKDK